MRLELPPGATVTVTIRGLPGVVEVPDSHHDSVVVSVPIRYGDSRDARIRRLDDGQWRASVLISEDSPTDPWGEYVHATTPTLQEAIAWSYEALRTPLERRGRLD